MDGLYDEDGIDGPFERAMAKPIKPPMKRWVVTYTDDCDRSRRETWGCYDYDAEHARRKFEDSDNGEGWEFISVDRPRDAHGKVDKSRDRR